MAAPSGDSDASPAFGRPSPITPSKFRRLNMRGLIELAAKINFRDQNRTAESERVVAEIGEHLLDKINDSGEWFCQRRDRSEDYAGDSAEECLSFTEWIIRFLLNLFSQPPSHHINPHASISTNKKEWTFDKCCKALSQLLRAVGRNDPVSFRTMQSNLSDLAVDLIRFRLQHVRSQRMLLAGQRMNLLHMHSFDPDPLLAHKLRWPPMTLTTVTTDHEVENLIRGVVGALIDSRSFSQIPLDEEVQKLSFHMAHVSQVRFVENVCVKWFTCVSDWQSWTTDRVASFLDPYLTPLLTTAVTVRDENGTAVIPSELKSGFSTIFHLLHYTRDEEVWRTQLLLWFIRMGWDARDKEIRDAAMEYISTVSHLMGFGRETGKVFIADAARLTESMIDLLLKEQPRNRPEDVFHSGISMFGDSFNFAFKHIIVKAVISNDPAVIHLAQQIVQKDDSRTKNFQTRFPEICAMLVQKLDNWKDVQKALEKVGDLAGTPVNDIMRPRLRFVAAEVLFHFNLRPKNVIKMMDLLSTCKSATEPRVTNNASLNGFLRRNPCLPTMLAFAGYNVKKKGIGRYSDQIRSLIDLIHVAGSEGVGKVQSLIAPLLNFCVRLLNQTNEEYELIAEFYSAYLQNVPFKILEENLLLICKDLFEQLLPKHKVKAVQLLEKVICDNADCLQKKLRDVSFVRDRSDADFDRLNKAIDHACAHFPEDNHIAYVMERTREIAEARESMLKVLKIGELRNYISRHYEDVITADDVHPCISELISTLLKDAKQPDDELSLAIARCLGEIGAIDPVRFDVIPASDSYPENTILFHDVKSKIVMKVLVSKISRFSVSFSDCNSQWLIMFVLQELMRSMDLKDQPAFLKILADDVRHDCESVTDSQYSIPPGSVSREVDRISLDSPIFSSEEAGSPLKYETWLRIWAKRMIFKMRPKSIACKVLMGCAPLFANDYRLTESLLPCIVFHLLSDTGITDEEKRRIVFDEINAVISSAVPNSFLMNNAVTFDNSSCELAGVVVSAPVLSELQHLSAQQIFVLHDTLMTWNESKKVEQIDELMKFLSKHCLAALAYACRSYARSILYLEKYFRGSSSDKDSSVQMELLQKNFIAMDEPDGVIGVEACRTDMPSLIDRVMAYESTCQLRRALTCCGKAARSSPDDIIYRKLVTRCLLALDLTQEAYHYAVGLISQSKDWESAILPLLIQAAWRLSMWSEVTRLLERVGVDDEEMSMNVHFGRILSHIANSDTDGLLRTLDSVRCIALNPIAAIVSEKGAYLRCYNNLIKLHMITDMQRAALDLCSMKPEPNTRHDFGLEFLGDIWKLRNQSVMTSCQTLEPVLSMQRVLCSIYREPDDVAKHLTESWLSSAMIARKSGNLPKADNCVLEIESLMEKDVVTKCTTLVSRVLVEVAKCYWAGQDPSSKEQAIKYLRRGMEQHFDKITGNAGQETPRRRAVKLAEDQMKRSAYARVRLLHTKFLEQSQSADSKKLIAGYTEAMNADPDWEKPVFRLARLYDRIASVTTKTTEKVIYMDQACRHYYMSLERGCKKINQSLPRLIDLWCEMGSYDVFFSTALNQLSADRRVSSRINVLLPSETERNKEIRSSAPPVKETFENLTRNVFANIHKNLPTQYLYTAFSQLLSRVNHSNVMLTHHLRDILARVVSVHPQQCLWHLLPALMSSTTSVSTAAQNIIRSINSIAELSSDEKKKFAKFSKLMLNAGDVFLKLAEEKVGKEVLSCDLSVLKFGADLKKLLEKEKGILLPYRKFMRVEMPPSGRSEKGHKYFAAPVNIVGVDDKVEIFSSLARPKKIILLGSDGKRYPLLVKPNDDMRMDSRTMEWIELVNRLLLKDAESRKRRLCIRSFHVVPLGSSGGLVEFIDGTRDIRRILVGEYARVGRIDRNTYMQDIKQKYPSKEASPSLARTKFEKDVIPKFKPPVFSGWFMDTFRDASVWHATRNEFTRSLAVMSIVGYVIGLGDRHLENILLDTKTGQAIHVDFNCLFDKGQTLEVPEVVPFRLTHNLVDAMGRTGFEGHFRKTCEVTLRVMRNNREELMSILKPFVVEPYAGHDAQPKPPSKNSFIEKKVTDVLGKGSATAHDIQKIEVHDETAEANLARIDDRLRGCIRSNTEPNPLPLSVAGQVNILIQEATNADNLCRMFVGWASYL